jgi:hypothetical protein
MLPTGTRLDMNKLPIILGLVFAAVVLLAIYVRHGAGRAAKRSGSGGNPLGWALLFLTSGRMPPPPPEAQIEAELNSEKDRGASDPLRKPYT